jgi:DNA-binding response OmpR family regulator
MQTPINIMVVDDEPSICRNVKKILSGANMVVTSATSAREALDQLAQRKFDMVISDIIMPETNGLELLKTVKRNWPQTKALMMTAYASTDTAVKAIRLGALDYIPKPFTPNELRKVVEEALAGRLIEAKVTSREKEAIAVKEVSATARKVDDSADAAPEEPGAPKVAIEATAPIEGFCQVGAMVCDIFKKLGATCKAGTKSGECPQIVAKRKKEAETAAAPARDVRSLVGIDQPFDYEEVSAVTGPEYLAYLRHDGVVLPTYEELKANVAQLEQKFKIARDVPFDRDEVAKITGEQYADTLNRSDMPEVQITVDTAVEGFCAVGSMVCDIFKKLGATCKAGTKSGECPQRKARKKQTANAVDQIDKRRWIAVDMPFDYAEVAAITGPEYVDQIWGEGVVQKPYEKLKADYEELVSRERARTTAAADEATVLVIDDEVAVNNSVRKALIKRGYAVDQATTKEAALEKVAARAYRLILLDLRIPGVQGLELLSTIRTIQPNARVIIITGYASIETAKEAARIGAIDYVPKPFTPNEIREAAQKAFRLAA